MLAKQVLYHLSYASSPFCSGYFGDKVLQNTSLGWPCFEILPISASQVARIIVVSHPCPCQRAVLRHRVSLEASRVEPYI
jgi:hypothetical protein